MQITKERLAERRALMASQRDKALVNLAAVNQAISECEFWLAMLNEPEPQENKDAGAVRSDA